MLNQFWVRWKSEYLFQLKNVHFSKPINNSSEFNMNDLVLIGDDRLPRQLWKTGCIIDLHKEMVSQGVLQLKHLLQH